MTKKELEQQVAALQWENKHLREKFSYEEEDLLFSIRQLFLYYHMKETKGYVDG